MKKEMVRSRANLEYELEGASHVLYFTHDYLSMASDKNEFLKVSADVANKHGVERFIAVCPVEYEMHYTEGSGQDVDHPISLRDHAEEAAMSTLGNKFCLIRPNLVFGEHAYYLHYLA